jgi:chromosome segregation ATPase
VSNDNAPILQAIQDLRSDVINELQSQRVLWQEAETTLLQRTELHRQRIDELSAKMEDVEQDSHEAAEWIGKLRRRYHDVTNKVQGILVELHEIRNLLAKHGIPPQRDTEAAPPPSGAVESG